MPVDREQADGRWLPAEPLPDPFGVVWGRLWHDRRRRGENKWIALFRSWRDVRSINRLGGTDG